MTGKKARHVRQAITLLASIFVLFLALTAAQCPSAGEGDGGGDGEEVTQRLYIGDNGKVLVVDPAAQSVVTAITIPDAGQLDWLAMRPDMQKLYCSDRLNSTVYIIDTATNTKTNEIAVNTHPRGIAFTTDGSKAAVARWGGSNYGVIDIIDTATETSLGIRDFGNIASLAGVDINHRNNKLYTADMNGCIHVSDVSTGTSGDWSFYPTSGGIFDVEVAPDGNKLYVSGTDYVNKPDLWVCPIDAAGCLSSFDIYQRSQSANTQNKIRISLDGQKLYYANFSFHVFDAISTSDPATMVPIDVGAGDAQDVAFSDDSSTAFVLSSLFVSPRIYIVDTSTHAVLGNFLLTGASTPKSIVYAVLP